jgi:hypothetical protein
VEAGLSGPRAEWLPLPPAPTTGLRVRPLATPSRLEEVSGTNRLGGLSTIAFRCPTPTPAPEFSYMADLALRAQLVEVYGPPVRLSGNFVTETTWQGQSQHSLVSTASDEAYRWVAERESIPLKRRMLSAAIARAYGHPSLSHAWQRTASAGSPVARAGMGLAGVIGAVASPLARLNRRITTQRRLRAIDNVYRRGW